MQYRKPVSVPRLRMGIATSAEAGPPAQVQTDRPVHGQRHTTTSASAVSLTSRARLQQHREDSNESTTQVLRPRLDSTPSYTPHDASSSDWFGPDSASTTQLGLELDRSTTGGASGSSSRLPTGLEGQATSSTLDGLALQTHRDLLSWLEGLDELKLGFQSPALVRPHHNYPITLYLPESTIHTHTA